MDRLLGKLRSAVAILMLVTLSTYGAAAYASPQANTRFDDRSDRGAARVAGPVRTLSNGLGGAVRQQTFRDNNGKRVGVRLDIEDAEIAETFEVDMVHDELSAFGLSFHPLRDASGNPTGLVIADAADRATMALSGDHLQAVTPDDAKSIDRIMKRFNNAHGHERAVQAQAVLQSVISAHKSSSRVAPLDLFNCVMDLCAIAVDWVGVVVACGAPVVNVFACGFAIVWATADTIHNADAAAADC